MSPARFRCATLLIFSLRIGQFLENQPAISLSNLILYLALFYWNLGQLSLS